MDPSPLGGTRTIISMITSIGKVGLLKKSNEFISPKYVKNYIPGNMFNEPQSSDNSII